MVRRRNEIEHRAPILVGCFHRTSGVTGPRGRRNDNSAATVLQPDYSWGASKFERLKSRRTVRPFAEPRRLLAPPPRSPFTVSAGNRYPSTGHWRLFFRDQNRSWSMLLRGHGKKQQ